MVKSRLPLDYHPFDELVVCTNTLINGKVPIEIEGHIPFLIGRGIVPQVWLSVIGPNGKWVDVLARNKLIKQVSTKSNKFLLTIRETAEDKRVDIKLLRTTILLVEKETNNKAAVFYLDLRPFGLSIHGDTTGLNIGSQVLRNNTVSNVYAMIGIGP